MNLETKHLRLPHRKRYRCRNFDYKVMCLYYTCNTMFCSPSRLKLIHENFQSSNPPFTSVEMDHSDSGREGCTVTTLTVTAEPKNWQSAVRVAVQEVCTF